MPGAAAYSSPVTCSLQVAAFPSSSTSSIADVRHEAVWRGDALYVSFNTINTYVKSIFRKLDVATRRDAVSRARELRLL
jgi:Bacterial regulatory proteins, luxR family